MRAPFFRPWSVYTGGFSLHLLTSANTSHSLERLHWWEFTASPLLVPMVHIPFMFGQNADKIFQAKFGNRNPFFSLI